MAAIYEVQVPDPQLIIDTWGAGCLLRWETSDDDGVTWAEQGTEAVTATTYEIVIEHQAGDDDTLFRSRYSTATPSTADHYGAYADVRPVVVDELVTTVAADDAESYLTVAEADVLATKDVGPEAEAWLRADTPLKEAALRRATREVDSHVATGWPPHDPDQALLFPREIDVDGEGDPVIPRKVVLATYQQAIYVLKNKDALGAMNAHRARSGDVDPEASYGTDPNNGPSIISPMTSHYLSGFRIAPKSGTGGGIGSLRVSSGFVGSG